MIVMTETTVVPRPNTRIEREVGQDLSGHQFSRIEWLVYQYLRNRHPQTGDQIDIFIATWTQKA